MWIEKGYFTTRSIKLCVWYTKKPYDHGGFSEATVEGTTVAEKLLLQDYKSAHNQITDND